MQNEFHILFPKTKSRLRENAITFSIFNMKCEDIAIVYHILHLYDLRGNELLFGGKPFHIGERWIVGKEYQRFKDTYSISDSVRSNVNQFQVELVAIKVTNNNPLRFNHIMLSEGSVGEFYHAPDEDLGEAVIGFNKVPYVNLYSNRSEDYLQIIRPNKDKMTTHQVLRSKCSVLVPHLEKEDKLDSPQNLLMEFLFQDEQLTTIDTNIFKR